MKKLKSYTGIWSVEKVVYAINDFNLPFPVSLSQMAWFVVSLLLVILLSKLPPLNLIKGAFLKYLGIPLFLTVFMNGKSFDDKKPHSFIKSVLLFLLRPKVSILGKSVKIHKGVVKKVRLKESVVNVNSFLASPTDLKKLKEKVNQNKYEKGAYDENRI